jgi:hypothetical protein
MTAVAVQVAFPLIISSDDLVPLYFARQIRGGKIYLATRKNLIHYNVL